MKILNPAHSAAIITTRLTHIPPAEVVGYYINCCTCPVRLGHFDKEKAIKCWNKRVMNNE